MAKTKFSKISTYFGVLLVLLFTLLVATEVKAQNQFSTDIAERLKQQGVPVMQVMTIRRLPYEIEIALQSSSLNEHLTVDDNWFMQLARREATFAYRISKRLQSFTLTVYNQNNELIYSTQTYLYPNDLNQRITIKQPKISIQESQEIVASQLQLGGLVLNKLNVIPDVASGSTGQILIVHVSDKDINSANRSLPIFLGSLFRFLQNSDAEYGTYIVLCHLRVLDEKGNILLDLIKDVESGSTQWTSMQGVYDGWHSKPTDAEEPVLESSPITPQGAYPLPLSSDSSLPSQESLTSPYPPPNLYP